MIPILEIVARALAVDPNEFPEYHAGTDPRTGAEKSRSESAVRTPR